jgi:CheY-like chemotaxis protein
MSGPNLHDAMSQGWLVNARSRLEATPCTNGILVVDDEACVRGVLEIGLRHYGFSVWLAANGMEAVGLYQRHRDIIDVILMDVRMPAPDGPRTLAALQELNARVRCIFMTGDLGIYSEEGLLALGAVAVLHKPLCLDEVAKVLGDATSSRRSDNP